jgi:L-fuculose-phosphate aldolase
MNPVEKRRLAEAIVDVCRRVYAKGWVANHDGNATVLLEGGQILATPTAWSKGDVTADSLLVVDGKGHKVAGTTRPFSEINLHLEAYQRREDVRAVLHAHPPHATALACAGRALGRPVIAEAIVSLGDDVPLVPYAPPGAKAAEAISPHLERVDAVLLQNHGVLTVGADIIQAFLRMELVEHLARIAMLAESVGGARAIPEADVPVLLAARAKAGLTPRPRVYSASAPAPAPAPAAARAHAANALAWATELRPKP